MYGIIVKAGHVSSINERIKKAMEFFKDADCFYGGTVSLLDIDAGNGYLIDRFVQQLSIADVVYVLKSDSYTSAANIILKHLSAMDKVGIMYEKDVEKCNREIAKNGVSYTAFTRPCGSMVVVSVIIGQIEKRISELSIDINPIIIDAAGEEWHMDAEYEIAKNFVQCNLSQTIIKAARIKETISKLDKKIDAELKTDFQVVSYDRENNTATVLSRYGFKYVLNPELITSGTKLDENTYLYDCIVEREDGRRYTKSVKFTRIIRE